MNEYGDFEDSFVNKNDSKEDMIMATKDMMVIEPWIILESKRFPGYYYFYNTESNEKQWRMPSNIVKVEKIFDSTPTKTTADNYSPTFQEWVDNKPQSATTFQLDNRSPNYTSPPMRYDTSNIGKYDNEVKENTVLGQEQQEEPGESPETRSYAKEVNYDSEGYPIGVEERKFSESEDEQSNPKNDQEPLIIKKLN